MGSHSVTCHPRQVNIPRLNPSQIHLRRRNGRLSWPRWLGTYRDGLPVSRQSPIQVVIVPGLDQIGWSKPIKKVKVKVKADIALRGNPISELYGTSLAIWESHSVTCHPTQVNAPRLTPAMQAGTRLLESWVDLVELIASRPGFEPATFRSRVRRRTTTPRSHPQTKQTC